MFKYDEILQIHLEPSSNCQASCPMCTRNIHGGLENPLNKPTDMNFDMFKKIIPHNLIKQLSGLILCGNYGDPILNKDLISIVRYVAGINVNIRLYIHTNGSARTTSWWKELAGALPKYGSVTFALDGLADTHHLYRQGTDFNTIIENAKAFISAGGNACWCFITFKHNEHQLEDAKKLAKELGFTSFSEKQSSRFIGSPYYDVVNKKGEVTHRLEQPTDHKLVFIDRKLVETYKDQFKGVKIGCEVQKKKSIYIDALGYLWPCCYIGGVPYQYASNDKLYSSEGQQLKQLGYAFQIDTKQSLNNLISKFNGLEQLNLQNRSIEEIINSPEWQSTWTDSFANDPNPVCTRTCGKFSEKIISQNKDQYLRQTNFNDTVE